MLSIGRQPWLKTVSILGWRLGSQIREGLSGILKVMNSHHAPVLEDADYEQNYGEQLLALSETYGKQVLHVSPLHPFRKQGVSLTWHSHDKTL